MLGYHDSREVVLFWDRTTPGESFCSGIERLHESHSVLGKDDSRGVILSRDRTTPGESLSPRIERLHWSHSVLR